MLKGFRYRRLRKSPYLNEYNKMLRYLWCLNYQKADFSKYVFVDETMVRIGDAPLYHYRLPCEYPDSLPCSSKFRQKVNVWGGISYKGATEFAVNYLF